MRIVEVTIYFNCAIFLFVKSGTTCFCLLVFTSVQLYHFSCAGHCNNTPPPTFPLCCVKENQKHCLPCGGQMFSYTVNKVNVLCMGVLQD